MKTSSTSSVPICLRCLSLHIWEDRERGILLFARQGNGLVGMLLRRYESGPW
jgi:hypothetical protein